MANARNRKDTATYINVDGEIIRHQASNAARGAAVAQPMVDDRECNPHTQQEAVQIIQATTVNARQKAAFRAMENDRAARPIVSKKRPVAASSSGAVETDQRILEAEQWAAYSENLMSPADVKQDRFTSGVDNDLYHGLMFNPLNSKPENSENTKETMPALFRDEIPQHILGYWDSDVADSKLPHAEREQLRFFGKQAKDSVFIALAKKVTEAFLGGEENEVEEAFAMVEKYPELLRCPPVLARDRSGSPDFRVMEPAETENELVKGEKNVYFNRAADGGLDYQLLDANGNHINDHITPQELGQEIKEAPPLTLPDLNKFRGRILKITTKRGQTPHGRLIKNTIIGTLAMAGEIDLYDDIDERIRQADIKLQQAETPEHENAAKQEKENLQKNRSLVERLAAIPGSLSKEEIAKQIEQAVVGDEAQKQTQQRANDMLAAIKQFGEGILSIAKDFKGNKENIADNFDAFQTLCKPHIDQLERVLQKDHKQDPNKPLKAGVIFDELTLYKAAEWFEYGYELCLLPKNSNNDVKLEKGKLYLEEKDGCVAYSVVTPDDKEVRHIKVDDLPAPVPFELNGFNNLNFGKQHERENLALKDKIFDAATSSNHIQTTLKRFEGWPTVMSEVFWINGYGKLQTKLTARSQNVLSHGLFPVIDKKEVPTRARNGDGISLCSSSTGCGLSYFLGLNREWLGKRGRGRSLMALFLLLYVSEKQHRCKTYVASCSVKTEQPVPHNVTLRR